MNGAVLAQGAQVRRSESLPDDGCDAEVAQSQRRGCHPRGHHAEPEIPSQVTKGGGGVEIMTVSTYFMKHGDGGGGDKDCVYVPSEPR